MSGAEPKCLWTAAEFVAAIGGSLDGALARAITGVSMDSRTLAPGEAFFAITGERLDGHRFVAAALARGAAVAVVADGFDRQDATGAILRVDEPLAAMRRLAGAARARSTARIIAVTGSVGKTGTKQGLALALAASGETHASPASFNNHWGVPFALANLPLKARFGVFEIGMNHAGEIRPLSRLVRPHIALVTAVAPVHIGHLGSIEAIADAKAEIFDGLAGGGLAVLNRDNDQFARLAAAAVGAGARVVSFGEHEEAEARLVSHVHEAGGSLVEADILGARVAYRLAAPGRHVVQNSLAVLAVTSLAGADLARGARALSQWLPARGRGERTVLCGGGGRMVLIDESYNANPASMGAAIAGLGAARPEGEGRRIAVLGDMLELGELAGRAHLELREPIVNRGIDLVFACGPLMRGLFDALPAGLRGGYAESCEELEGTVLAALRPGDVIMIKGSFAIGMGRLVEALKRPGQARAMGKE